MSLGHLIGHILDALVSKTKWNNPKILSDNVFTLYLCKRNTFSWLNNLYIFLSVPGTLIFIDRPQHVGYLSNKIAEYVLESQYSIKR